MSDDALTRPLVDPTLRRRRRIWIATGVLVAFVALVIAHLV
jgi:hypothetical protein